MTVVGLDVGSSGVRAVMLDADGLPLSRVALPLGVGVRTADGGHRLDESAILKASVDALSAVCDQAGRRPEAVTVSATAGTLCFRDGDGGRGHDPVAYDDARQGRGFARVAAWRGLLPDTARVIPIADAVLEELGADTGGTDWTNALKLGWDPVAERWPVEAGGLLTEGFLPDPVPTGTPAGEVSGSGPAAGALLVRGATDGCAMQIASERLAPGEWSISLGTTVTWKAVSLGEAPTLPPGAYAHRLGWDVWLPGAASNCGGGVLRELQPGCDLAERDRAAALPSRHAAYPLARPGERFPVADPRFAGFGLPAPEHPAFHAAILEGTGYVIRYGIEKLIGGGIPEWDRIRVTGGGARSPTWMTVIASVLRRTVSAAPDADAALGAALIAAAGLRGQPVGTVTVEQAALGPIREYVVDQGLRPSYAGGYSEFLGILSRRGAAGDG